MLFLLLVNSVLWDTALLLYNICVRRGFLGEVFFIRYLCSSYQCHVGTRW